MTDAELDEPITEDPKRDRLKMRTLLFACVGCILFTIVQVIALTQVMQSQKSAAVGAVVDERNTTVSQLADKQQELIENQERMIDLLKRANEDREAKGEPTLPIPPTVVPEPTPPPITPNQVVPQNGQNGQDGKDGKDGRDAPPPTLEQIQAAVAAYCRDHGGCRGPKGSTGPQVTAEQVAKAITEYCNARGDCRGEPGAEGSQGPGPTDEQVAAGIAEFCADGACRGADGKDGQNGKDGQDGQDGEKGDPGDRGPAGRSVIDARCVDGELIVFYSDDTSSSAGGDACKPQPTVTVTQEPSDEPT